MKNTQKGFLLPFLIILVVLLVIGGVYMVYRHDNTNWKTYTNNQHGYTLDYPDNVKVDLAGIGFDGTKWIDYSPESAISTTTKWYASTCVGVNSNDSIWYINILADAAFSQVPCGGTGTSSNNHPGTDIFVSNGEQASSTGRIEGDGSGATFYFNLSKDISVEYGIHATSSLSEQNYQRALNSIHSVLSTLKTMEDFVPTTPPNNGKG
jgi:hypothetical protein